MVECNTELESQSSKLKYATLLSLSMKGCSDILLTGSKITDSFILSSHKYMFESYCSISRVAMILTQWYREITEYIQKYAYENREIKNHPRHILSSLNRLRDKLVVEAEGVEEDIIELIYEAYNLSVSYLEERVKLTMKPIDNGDFEVLIRQITRITINTLRIFGAFVNSIDRVYQFRKFNYGKPIVYINTALIGKDRIIYVDGFIELIKKYIKPESIIIQVDDEIVKREDLLSCVIDEVLSHLSEKHSDIEFKSLYV